jgi:hypothetical protein
MVAASEDTARLDKSTISRTGGQHAAIRRADSRAGSVGRRRFTALGHGKIDGTPRHYGRDGVLVDHLRDGIAQQDNILVERFDLPLQLDAVDKIDGNRDVFSAQGIQEWILQKLTFVAHDILRVQDMK